MYIIKWGVLGVTLCLFDKLCLETPQWNWCFVVVACDWVEIWCGLLHAKYLNKGFVCDVQSMSWSYNMFGTWCRRLFMWLHVATWVGLGGSWCGKRCVYKRNICGVAFSLDPSSQSSSHFWAITNILNHLTHDPVDHETLSICHHVNIMWNFQSFKFLCDPWHALKI